MSSSSHSSTSTTQEDSPSGPPEPPATLQSLIRKRSTREDLAKSVISLFQHSENLNIEKTLRKRGYNLRKVVGQGAYAKVYITDYVDPSNSVKKETLACKVIDGSKAPKDFINKFFPRELNLMCKLNHHCVVRIHSMLKLSSKYFLFMHYYENGDLLGFMKKNGVIKECRARRWFAQILEGVEYLHSKNIVHRDLKCENILLTGDFQIRIADFGFARYFNEGTDEKSHTYCGSVNYAPPEVIHAKPYNPKLADIWSLGVVLFIMLNKSMPFDEGGKLAKLHESQMNRQWKIRDKIKDTLSPEVKTLIYILLEPVPEKRRSLAELRRDPWFLKESYTDLTVANPLQTSVGISENDQSSNQANEQTPTSQPEPSQQS